MHAIPSATYEQFATYISLRIASGQHLTEDSVRYSFFLALLLTTDIKQHELILELPHPSYPGKEIDTYIVPAEGRPATYVEFKFHRSSKSTSPKPQKAGGLFKDVARMASLASATSRCLVVYLTCPEMATYFDSKSSAYSSFWRNKIGSEFQYDGAFLENTTPTFRKVVGDLPFARVGVEYAASSLENKYQLRVFNIQPTTVVCPPASAA